MSFVKKNAVVLTSFVSAIVLVLQQAIQSGATDWKTIGFATFIALLGVVSKTWGGAGFTILGVIATLSGVFINNLEYGKITWNELLLSALVAVLLSFLGHLQAQKPSTNPEA